MMRFILLTGFCLVASVADAQPNRQRPFSQGQGGGGGRNNQIQSAPSYGPYTPGAQNQSTGGNRQYNSPFSTGSQNSNTAWNNQWQQGGTNWQPQPQYQPQQQIYQNQQNWNNHQQPQLYSHTPEYTPYRTEPRSSLVSPPAPQVAYSQKPIIISMPPEQSGQCQYRLSSGSDVWNFSMTPGKSQNLVEDRSWRVTFDRGSGYGEQAYRLQPGHYRFRQSSRGWELYHSTAAVAASSSTLPPPPAPSF